MFQKNIYYNLHFFADVCSIISKRHNLKTAILWTFVRAQDNYNPKGFVHICLVHKNHELSVIVLITPAMKTTLVAAISQIIITVLQPYDAIATIFS